MLFIASIFVILVTGYMVVTIWLWRETQENSIEKARPTENIPLSVVIVARNEDTRIAACIRAIVDNEYPEYEIILVDDHSADHTVSIAKTIGGERLRVIQLADMGITRNHKKEAIRIAVNQARHDHILTTDADCIVGEAWMKSMAELLERSDFITGSVTILSDGSYIGDFQWVEMMGTMQATAAGIRSRFFFSANTANMAFKKSVYKAFDCDRTDLNTASGDDIFFIHWAAARSYKINYNNHPGAVVATWCVKTLVALFRQRIRWAKKSGQYSDYGLILFLGFHWSYVFAGFLLLALSAKSPSYALMGVFLLVLKSLSDCRVLKRKTGFNVWYLFSLSMMHSIYLLVLPMVSLLPLGVTWKGRHLTS